MKIHPRQPQPNRQPLLGRGHGPLGAFLVAVVWSLTASLATGQEIRLRSQAAVATSIVTLGQVAEVLGGSAEDRAALQTLELGLQTADRSAISQREIREALAADGWNLLYWEVSGANQVQLHSALPSATRMPNPTRPRQEHGTANARNLTPSPASYPTMHPSTQKTSIAQTQWLEPTSAATDSSSPRLANAAADLASDRQASTGWAFKQEMKRGQIVTESDLERVLLPRTPPRGAVAQGTEVIGQVLRQTVPAGRPILASYLEPIKHVQRGGEVRLLSRVGAVEISTTARSLADATLGQTVTVESLDRKRQYVAQVVGFHTVQIVSATQMSDGLLVDQTPVAAPIGSPRPRVSVNNPLR